MAPWSATKSSCVRRRLHVGIARIAVLTLGWGRERMIFPAPPACPLRQIIDLPMAQRAGLALYVSGVGRSPAMLLAFISYHMRISGGAAAYGGLRLGYCCSAGNKPARFRVPGGRRGCCAFSGESRRRL
ncbi:hypothetical protein SKAU_G00091260 [Synaphobranchus kaupii]|uniref:Uncharacterized protein n=1 Tax=Synaphobranchus kaupii TaxID=118154 RepID=A0A9Q1FWJ8_SYNKA|nr:hypothetical protein SKAU_G00091260 [Synaphobranchus kaupii]